ncbi:MAG: hypothetical protein F4Y03_18430 [Alphaproteobacteria bacterium]|nr:hypothetical protein [Alphaproteobacteria bacterium]
MAARIRASIEAGCRRSIGNWRVRRGLASAAMAAVMVAALALAVSVGPEPAQACLLPGIPC